MSFSSQIKEEAVRLRVKEPGLRRSELSGLAFACGNLKLGRRRALSCRTENREVGRHIASLAAGLYAVEVQMEERVREHRQTPLYVVDITGPQAAKMLEEIGVLYQDAEGLQLLSRLPQALLLGDDNKRAFIRGCFLGSGSCSDPKGAYTLDILCPTETFAQGLCRILTDYGLCARYTQRRSRFVVYMKDGDSITGFLALMGANGAALAFENVRAEKETRNYVNRATNCEYANLEKLVAASLRQQEAVKAIMNRGHFQKLPPALREAAELRLNYPDAGLQELADLAGIKKSGMNHRLTRLLEYAQDLENGLL